MTLLENSSGCPKKIAQLHSSSCNLVFETLFESICLVVADLWQKISDCFLNSISIVLEQCQYRVSFQRRSPDIELKFSLNFLKDGKWFLFE